MPNDRKLLVLLIVLLILLAVFALPVYPWSIAWGVYPSGFVFLVAVIVVALVASGQI